MTISEWLDSQEATGKDVAHIVLPDELSREEDPEETIFGSSLKSMGNVVCNMIEIRHQELEEVDTDRDERHRSFSVGFGFETAVASGVV